MIPAPPTQLSGLRGRSAVQLEHDASPLTRIGIGVFALDSFRRVVFAHPAGERLLGVGLKIMNGRLCVRARRNSRRRSISPSGR